MRLKKQGADAAARVFAPEPRTLTNNLDSRINQGEIGGKFLDWENRIAGAVSE